MGSNAPIYLVSVPRSGATLLGAMLNNHRNIAMFNEPWFFYMLPKYGTLRRRRNAEILVDDLSAAARKFGVLVNQELKEDVLRMICVLKSSRHLDAFGNFMELYAKRMGKTRWGVKQPIGIFDVPQLLTCFSDLKVIHIVRDPRATVAHRMGKKSNGEEKLVDSLRFSNSWAKMIRFAGRLSETFPRNYFELRYEDLITNQVIWLEQVCEFLNEDYDRNMMEYYKAENPYVPRDKDGRPAESHQDVLLPVHTKDVDSWKSLLSSKEISIVEGACSEGMARYGYYRTTFEQRVNPFLLWITAIRLRWRLAKHFITNRIAEDMFHACRKALVFLSRKE